MLYLFKCSRCGRQVEVLQKAQGPHRLTRACRGCGFEGEFKRVFTPPQVVYKGRGWPVKDQWLEREIQRAQESAERHYNQPPKNPLSENDDFFQEACELGLDRHRPKIYGDPTVMKDVPASEKGADTA